MLCVDQSSDVLACVREVLRGAGYNIVTNRNLYDALILMRATLRLKWWNLAINFPLKMRARLLPISFQKSVLACVAEARPEIRCIEDARHAC